MKSMLKERNGTRRSFLTSIYRPGNGGSFKYDVNHVCLWEAFHFSRDLQCSIKLMNRMEINIEKMMKSKTMKK